MSEKCPECGTEPIILRTFEDWMKLGGIDGEWYEHPERIVPMYGCLTDHLFWRPNPPLWKRFLMGPWAYPKELRK